MAIRPKFGKTGLAVLGVLLLAGCVTQQVSVERIGQQAAYHEAMDSALTDDRPGSRAILVLRRYGMEQDYQKNPDKCLSTLWPKVLVDGRRDAFYAMAELCLLRAKELDRPAWRFGNRDLARDTYLAAAISAYHYLFRDLTEPPPTAYDRHLRIACDLYNLTLGKAFSDPDGRVTLQSGTRRTPLGEIHISFEQPERINAMKALDALLINDQYAVSGLEVRNRVSGLGTPVIAVKRRDSKRPFRQTICGTFILLCDTSIRQDGVPLRGSLKIVTASDPQTIEIGEMTVPVETDQTVPIAYAISDPLVWKLGRQVFRLGQAPVHTGIYPTEPYVPGKIPVLLVHGTMSSPFLWADMWNSLRADPEIRRRCQFWLYFYESSRPLGVSAANLRESITSMVTAIDPEGRDPALKQMVVIGHSQGGLLTKMTAVDTGEALLQALTGHSLAELKLSAADNAIAHRYAIFTPLPQVRRVVFISTPHRGSYKASGLARSVVRHLVQIPTDLTQLGTVLNSIRQRIGLPAEFRNLPTSVDGMSPKNPVMLRLAEIPVASGVYAHSIIPIKGNDIPPEGRDGVVAYASAHLDGVESEYVVRDGHSCQGNPLVIEEVRRILLEHLQMNTPDRLQQTR